MVCRAPPLAAEVGAVPPAGGLFRGRRAARIAASGVEAGAARAAGQPGTLLQAQGGDGHATGEIQPGSFAAISVISVVLDNFL